jgi:CopG family nickel-responsive transcriptional regulator
LTKPEVQHANHELVVSTSHAHLDHDSCLEVLIVHGKSWLSRLLAKK